MRSPPSRHKTNADDFSRWGIQRRHDELAVNFRTTWDLYIKFFTVFLTINIAAIAWLFGSVHTTATLWYVSLSFVTQALFCAVTSIGMVLFTRNCRLTQKDIEACLVEMAAAGNETVNPDKCFKSSLPFGLARYAALANFSATITIALIWFALAAFRSS